jgi:hypothetical protein
MHKLVIIIFAFCAVATGSYGQTSVYVPYIFSDASLYTRSDIQSLVSQQEVTLLKYCGR